MSTNLEIIEDALRDINVLSEVDNASAEQGAYALRKLNQMMELWKEQSIDVGWYAQTATTDDIPVPDWMEGAVTAGLAIACAPKYGATVSRELGVIADNAISTVKRKLISEGLQNRDMSHMPIGSGHYGRGYDITSDT